MDNVVEFLTADGHSVLVETSDDFVRPLTRGGQHGGLLSQAQQTIEEALGQVQPAIQALIDQLVGLTHRPSEVSVEFGVNLHAEAGALIARTGGAANFTVKLIWDGARPD